jgi:hypothetical protein
MCFLWGKNWVFISQKTEFYISHSRENLKSYRKVSELLILFCTVSAACSTCVNTYKYLKFAPVSPHSSVGIAIVWGLDGQGVEVPFGWKSFSPLRRLLLFWDTTSTKRIGAGIFSNGKFVGAWSWWLTTNQRKRGSVHPPAYTSSCCLAYLDKCRVYTYLASSPQYTYKLYIASKCDVFC